MSKSNSDAETGYVNRRKPTLSHRIEYVATRLVVGALRLVGWRAASWIGGRIARLAYWPLGIRRGVTTRQIAAAFPEKSNSEIRRIAVASYDSLGRTSIETAILPGTKASEILSRIERVDGWEHLERSLAQKHGLIIVTGHIGNWEVGGAYMAARGLPLDVVARGMSNPVFENWVNRTRSEIGMQVIHDQDAVRKTPRSLKANRAVAFVSDHDALGLASTYVPFFSRPARTPRGPGVFALRFGAPILFMVCIRMASGRYTIFIEPIEVVITDNKDADVDNIMLRFTQLLEDKVRKYPEQYFWQHRRWRRQPPDTPPHLREP